VSGPFFIPRDDPAAVLGPHPIRSSASRRAAGP
jgi:hypothetical protein